MGGRGEGRERTGMRPCRAVTPRAGSVSFFFFQAEDGIRDYKVTGVQTCALPISEGGEAEDERGGDGDLVEPALDRRSTGQSAAAAEHVGQSRALPAVQQDEQDRKSVV